MEIIFWTSFCILFYLLLGYPLALLILAKFFGRPIKKNDDFLPNVSIVIAAYNEEQNIKAKIENTLALAYPRELLEIMVFSDSSTDGTDEVVRSFESAGVRLLRYEGRLGKTECQNRVVAEATGEIIVFSDANSMYDQNAIVEIARNFADSSVGAVCGELRYAGRGGNEGLYWKLEQFLKTKESVLGSCLGSNGAIYALRKNLYVPLSPDAISDFVEPFMIRRAGYRVVYEPKAFAREPVSGASDFRRKRRIVLRSIRSLRFISEFLNPVCWGGYSIALWSHKVLRWFMFVPLVLILTANWFLLDKEFYQIVFSAQVLFYLFAFVGVFYRRKPFSTVFDFVSVNVASVSAVIGAVLGRHIRTWTPVRGN